MVSWIQITFTSSLIRIFIRFIQFVFSSFLSNVIFFILLFFLKIFEDVSVLWSSLITSASPFLRHQRNENHFDFFGLDIVCDQSGKCWLIEVNR